MCLPQNHLFMVSKDKWDTKEGPDKFIKNALYVQQKAHLSTSNSKKIKPVAFAIVELCESEGIRQLVSQSVTKFR